ncbi:MULTISPECIES: dicarboxylate/amino acid:cation symporter [unclassified Salinivibrio]|uniref:dicarboxylate/amino acid:cation symporter n=1 Tax=unclassified Salinivibrio TaxID=2636825 RepID=UPI0009891811|nr:MULTISPECIES: dicarboxylate/amino acid:cation symporter [unclassified Salinivibrio]OOF09376.1 Na+:H+ dicarboxylate symporter [Salinivibrio sp. PR5]OOF19038.1 Na+:H+ dicarboxylate symporter [Salinivibrio sp. PR932]OOF22246.1 Na+:H+ dicarboxylate symporter [Salinivibrio sp. IB574]PCE67999.1 Na+:H+ dicarboxylate symporter [Salinivibrio sp. YCSC6]QCF35106.1 dicarboxylate/amino acid:cation symporter [Salinivibrio sp. YCSC6]
MWKTLRHSLPLQIAVAAALAWLVGTVFGPIENAEQTTWYPLLMLAKVSYIGLLKAVVGVMVLLSLLEGISNIGNVVRLKRLGGATLLFYGFTTTIAITIGLGAALMMPEWQPLTNAPPVDESISFINQDAAGAGAIATKLINMALVNPFAAVTQGNLLAIVVFTILFGISLIVALPESHPLFETIRGLNKGINTMVAGIIKLAPFAVFAIVFQFSHKGDNDLFGQLFSFAALVFGLTMVHALIVLPLIARVAGGIGFVSLFRAISAPLAMAFATSSSAATLPVSMQAAKEELKVTPSTASMVLPLGAVMNMDGTALFEGIAAVFLAQLFGIDLSTTGIVMIFIMAMVSSVGAPGMPSGSMSGMQLVLLAAGIPLEAIAILLIIERPLDTFRTAVNVQGDLIGATVIDKWQKRFG